MRLTDFDYDLPKSCIAQQPIGSREDSRLLWLDKNASDLEHRIFSDLPDLLRPGDLLVLNDTQVIPARLHGQKQTGGKVEILLDRPMGPEHLESGAYTQSWSCLMKASRSLRPEAVILLPDEGQAVGEDQGGLDGQVRIRLILKESVGSYLARYGETPLPRYIRRQGVENRLASTDRERYQTVFAKNPGAVAAPTAGLHFSKALLQSIQKRGIEVAFVTLHVGPGTFLPVRCEEIDAHVMHGERYHIPQDTVLAFSKARQSNGRVVAVGTTVVRTLESSFHDGALQAGQGETTLFIRPGHRFEAVDALITNFHLPQSTLLILVCAFAGTQRVLDAYQEAVKRGYRFYSYGDAMLVS